MKKARNEAMGLYNEKYDRLIVTMMWKAALQMHQINTLKVEFKRHTYNGERCVLPLKFQEIEIVKWKSINSNVIEADWHTIGE